MHTLQRSALLVLRVILLCVAIAFPISPLFAEDASSGSRDTVSIDAVRLEGNRAIDSEALFSQINISSGALSREEISAEVRNLFETGFFDQVQAKREQTSDGRSILVFVLSEKPTVRKVFIKGNDEIDEKDLAEVFTFAERRFLDEASVQLLIRQAKAYYQTKGFYRATFDYAVAPVGENQVDVTFTVEEGERLRVREVEFRGLERIDQDDLQGVIQTSRYKWWNSWLFGTGRLSEEALKNDRLIVRQYFLDHGFLDGTVSEPSTEIREDGIYVSFDIDEGDVYTVGEIGVSGDLIDGDPEKTKEGVELEVGETFEANVMRADVFRITEKFTERGYAFANVVPNTSINPQAKTVAVNFAVEQGKEVFVDRIRIRGNTKTYDNVIRRELRIVEGEKFSSARIARSERLLQRLGYFEEVSIATDTKEGSDEEVDLTVNVREASTGTFSAGAGFSSDQGALFNARLSENNLFGTGKRLSINADLGDQRENLVLSYQDRRYDDSFWIVGGQLLLTEREFIDFDRQIDGGNVTLGYPLEEFFGEWSEDINFTMQYEYLDVNISNVDENDAAQLVIDSQGGTTASAITPQLTRNTINNPLNPTEGSRQSLGIELAGLGGSEEYYLITALQQLYHPIYRREEGGTITFGWRTRFAYGETYDGDTFPLFRRFFPGGINSVRGFEARTLGPKDDRGNEFGGSKQLINNFEFIFPVLTSAGLQGVVFYDVGEAFDDDETLDLGELRQAYGFGIRWTSPLGPIRIEFGIPLDREEGEDSLVTLFSFGAPL
ncbi:outer membrane protein assembly factor BamA [bacterium]|nr:outer membrane protein assembly factor BamA [bacterium]